MIYRCRVCGKRIRREIADRALSRGKVPAYCGPAHRNTGKARIRRAHLKLDLRDQAFREGADTVGTIRKVAESDDFPEDTGDGTGVGP